MKHRSKFPAFILFINKLISAIKKYMINQYNKLLQYNNSDIRYYDMMSKINKRSHETRKFEIAVELQSVGDGSSTTIIICSHL